MRSDPQFCHLSVRTEYSLKDSIVRLEKLIKAVKADRQTAVAITDHHNFFAAIKFYKLAISQQIKPILGVTFSLSDPACTQSDRVLCYCMNETGYRRLIHLISRAYTEGQINGIPKVSRSWLTPDHLVGVLVILGGLETTLARACQQKNWERVETECAFWQQRVPGRIYIGITRYQDRAEESAYIDQIVPIAAKAALPIVAIQDVCFLKSDEFTAHEARVCIQKGDRLSDPKRMQHYYVNQFLQKQADMVALYVDLPSACQNTVEIVKRCNLTLTLGEVHLPNFPVPETFTIRSYLAHLTEVGFKTRFPDGFENEAVQQQYHSRLEIELSVINRMGFAGYFLVVADFIQWAKAQAIPVGPGRGSGAGSLVAYVLKITDLDPLRYDLLFERFLNPERVSLPDFDIDFCMERRDEVIEYVSEKYGRQAVSQIITFGTMAAKAVVRDVGRVLGQPYGFVDKIAKLIPFDIGMTLKKAIEQNPELKERYHQEEDVAVLIDLAMVLEGLTRNVGKHAGGVVIAPGQLTDFLPLYCDTLSEHFVTQFDKNDVAQVGLVKFDFLGLRTLTIIQWACDNILKQYDLRVDINAIPLEDPKTFKLLQSGLTTAVFQLESRGMRDLIHRLQPDQFEEIMALVALFRPGPLQSGMVEDFIRRKKGLAEIIYPHPDLVSVLKPTYGVILYQEQVMQIAQILAGYRLGAADLLRHAMGKKKPEAMAEQRKNFLAGAKAREVDLHVASAIFDLMEKFSGYGFNKSHSAAYALIAYQTAWLKTHYPACFMAAVLSADLDHTDKIQVFLKELKVLKIHLLPPDVNCCDNAFSVKSPHEIYYGLGAIKGVGQSLIQMILAERARSGSFKNPLDFFERLDRNKLNKRALEALIDSGSFDSLGMHRSELFANLDLILQQAKKKKSGQAVGQGDFFSEDNLDETYIFKSVPAWDLKTILKREKQVLGFYLSGHPVQCELALLKKFISHDLSHLANDRSVIVAGLLTKIRKLTTKRGKFLVVLTIDDGVCCCDITVFSELFETVQTLLVLEHIIIVRGETTWDDYNQSIRVLAKEVYTLDEYRMRQLKSIQIQFKGYQDQKMRSQDLAKQIECLYKVTQLTKSTQRMVPISLWFVGIKLKCQLALPEPRYVDMACDKVTTQLKKFFLRDAITEIYS